MKQVVCMALGVGVLGGLVHRLSAQQPSAAQVQQALAQQPGLADVLAGERPLHEALIQTDIPNLVILPPGAYGPHIPELLAGRAPSLLVAEIGRRYPDHVIVMDTPPCLASTDPSALAPISGQVVFVIEAGSVKTALFVGLVIVTVGAVGGYGLPTLQRPML